MVGARVAVPMHEPDARAHLSNREQGAVYFQENPFLSEWLSPEQVAEIRTREDMVQERVQNIIERGIASGEFVECDSHVMALGYIGMVLGSYRWLNPSGRRSAQEIAVEFSTTLLRGLIRDEATRINDPLGSRRRRLLTVRAK